MSGRRIPCFLIEPTGMVRQQLRRYSKDSQRKCPGVFGYHNSMVPFMMSKAVLTEYGTLAPFPPFLIPHPEDTRWPLMCAECGDYHFLKEDHWQVFQEVLYHRPGVDESFTIETAPMGSMWNCPWYPTKGPDGMCLCIKTPGGSWMPDLPSLDGTPWQRTGPLSRCLT